MEVAKFLDKNPEANVIKMLSTGFDYDAKVKTYKSFKLNKDTYKNVRVIYLKMSWNQYCGELCAMGFTRNKIVIFNEKNEPIALYIDAFGSYWVS